MEINIVKKNLTRFGDLKAGDTFFSYAGHFYLKVREATDMNGDEFNAINLGAYYQVWFDPEDMVDICDATLTILD